MVGREPARGSLRSVGRTDEGQSEPPGTDDAMAKTDIPPASSGSSSSAADLPTTKSKAT